MSLFVCFQYWDSSSGLHQCQANSGLHPWLFDKFYKEFSPFIKGYNSHSRGRWMAGHYITVTSLFSYMMLPFFPSCFEDTLEQGHNWIVGNVHMRAIRRLAVNKQYLTQDS